VRVDDDRVVRHAEEAIIEDMIKREGSFPDPRRVASHAYSGVAVRRW
jgi:hypothetical protein